MVIALLVAILALVSFCAFVLALILIALAGKKPTKGDA